MPAIQNLVARGNILFARDDPTGENSGLLVNLLITFMALLFFSLILVAALIVIRRMRKQQAMVTQSTLPQYNDIKRTGNHRRLTIQTGNGHQSVLVFGKDGEPMLANPNSPPHSPDNVPQIHITFPDEQDEYGRRKSGRVVVVRVGDTTVGLEPVQEEQLPAYEKENSSQFYSIDIDQLGGLKEKDRTQFV